MAFERITDYFPGVTASPDLSAKQYYAVYLASGSEVTLPDGSASEIPIGILQNEPGSGETAQVSYVPGDICKALFHNACAVTYWNALWVDSSARVIKQYTDACPCFARALESSTASGVISILLTGPNTVLTGSDGV